MGTSTHAVVLGSGIAGMATARVLSKHFDRVTVIERDAVADVGALRAGLPQGRHPHLLIRRGFDELEALFPGFIEELRRRGAVSVTLGDSFAWYCFGRWRPRYEPGIELLSSSRAMLEGTVRDKLAEDSRVVFRGEISAVGLKASADRSTIVGVELKGKDGRTETLEADLVADASGRSSHTPQWLAGLGYGQVATTNINAFPGYATRIYERPPGLDFKAMYVQPTPPGDRRGGIAFPLEGGLLYLCLVGMAKDYPPTDEAGYLAFLESLPTPRLRDAIAGAKPVSGIAGYRMTSNRMNAFDRMKRWPENFVALGDSVCAFNPVYGQGMTVAVMSAQMLDDELREHRGERGASQRFQRKLAGLLAFPWGMSTGEDMRWLPVTEGCPRKPDLPTAARLGFIKRIMIASTYDPYVAEVLNRVMNMKASPAEFLRPRVVVSSLRRR